MATANRTIALIIFKEIQTLFDLVWFFKQILIVMKNIQFPVYLTSLVLAFYTLTPFIGVPYALIGTLFLSLNILIIWMVVRVLKDGVPSNKTFKESWYEDLEVEI